MRWRRTGTLWFGVGFAATLLLSGTYSVYFTTAYKERAGTLGAMWEMTLVTAFAWLFGASIFAIGSWLMRSQSTPVRAAVAGFLVAMFTNFINYPVKFLNIPIDYQGPASLWMVGLACFLAAKLASLGSPTNSGSVA